MTIKDKIHFSNGEKGNKQIKQGRKKKIVYRTGRIPRLSKFMALAIRFKDLIQYGNIKDFADIASLGHVCRARLTQIMNLNLLARISRMISMLLPCDL